MTIAVGLLADDGVVLAADTQLTGPSILKGEGGKIQAWCRRSQTSGACAITGASNIYDYLHALGDELMREFKDTLDDADKETAYERFGDVVLSFHGRHVLPEPDQPETSVLVAYQRNGDTALWQSTRGVFIDQPDYAAVGIGAAAATAWLGKVWIQRFDIPSAVILATFAAAVAKDSKHRRLRQVHGCDCRRGRSVSADCPRGSQ